MLPAVGDDVQVLVVNCTHLPYTLIHAFLLASLPHVSAVHFLRSYHPHLSSCSSAIPTPDPQGYLLRNHHHRHPWVVSTGYRSRHRIRLTGKSCHVSTVLVLVVQVVQAAVSRAWLFETRQRSELLLQQCDVLVQAIMARASRLVLCGLR